MGRIVSHATPGDTQWGQCSLFYYKDKGWPVWGLFVQYLGVLRERPSTDNCLRLSTLKMTVQKTTDFITVNKSRVMCEPGA